MRQSICVKQAMSEGDQQAVTELGTMRTLMVELKDGTRHCVPRDPSVADGIRQGPGRSTCITNPRLKLCLCMYVCVFEYTLLVAIRAHENF